MGRTEMFTPEQKDILLTLKQAFPYLAPVDLADLFFSQTGKRMSRTYIQKLLNQADIPPNQPGRPTNDLAKRKNEILKRS